MQQGVPSRRLTTILAMDVVGYSQMTARDEDHAIRIVRQRFATAASFVTQHEGRVFNTAGDAMLAEFPSPVEAVRCALEIQEAMRTANSLADEADCLQLKIGVNLGDVVVSGSDLLGDGVNIAARLESIATAGGVCVSASVYEQLIGKLTLGAEDLGDQHVKNIARPIRAYRLTPQGAPPVRVDAPQASTRKSGIPLSVLAITLAVVAAGGGGALYLILRDRPSPPLIAAQTPVVVAADTLTAPTDREVPKASRRAFVPEDVPFIDDRGQEHLRSAYMPGSSSKAVALSSLGYYGFKTQRVDEETAKKEALEICTSSLKKVIANPSLQVSCFVYAVGDEIVWSANPPPIPAQPWVAPNRPLPLMRLDPEKTPLISASSRKVTAERYLPARPAKALALGRAGVNLHTWNRASDNAAMRAALQGCGYQAQRACFIFALNDEIVVQIPELMRAIDVLSVADLPGLSNTDRQRIEASYVSGADWRALAIGRNSRIGIAVRQLSEQAAVDQALRDCGQGGGLDCAVAAIGPFIVARR